MDDDSRRSAETYALEVGSGLATASAGLLVAGPPGAVLGALIGPTFTRMAKATRDRLQDRDRVRALTALGYAALAVSENIKGGRELRDDWFVPGGPGSRIEADEIAEAVLQAASLDPEERKLPHYGSLLGRLAFAADVGRYDANRWIRMARHLTYRQYVLLAIAATGPFRPPYNGVELRWAGNESPINTTWALLHVECGELEETRLLAPEPTRHNNRALTRAGLQFVDLLDLAKVRADDSREIQEELQATVQQASSVE